MVSCDGPGPARRHARQRSAILAPFQPRPGPAAPDPIDRDHLARQTAGDRDLEREILALFMARCADLVAKLDGGAVGAADLAHSLKGSALAIGAGRVAALAAACESAARDGRPTAFRSAVAELRDAVAGAHAAAQGILRD